MIKTSPQPFNPGELADEEIVRRVCGGEAELFELLLRRHNQRIYRAVCAVLQNRDEAEDVMQQAYVSAFRNLRQFEGRAAFSTWMTRIALREAFARNRKLVAMPQPPSALRQEERVRSLPQPGPDPEQRVVTSDLMNHVEAEVAALPEAYRSVFMLREIEGLSTEETAECLDLSVDVVKTRLHRARGMLRDALFRRVGVGLHSTFTFGALRCDRLVARVMSEIPSGCPPSADTVVTLKPT